MIEQREDNDVDGSVILLFTSLRNKVFMQSVLPTNRVSL